MKPKLRFAPKNGARLHAQVLLALGWLFVSQAAVVWAQMAAAPPAARWRPETTDWSRATNLVIGDWGFNRPGFPKGLYLHGVTMPEGHFPEKPLPNPIIYDNDEYADVLDDDVLCAMASLGKITLAAQIITPIDPKGVFKPAWQESAFWHYDRCARSGMSLERIPKPLIGNTNATPNPDSPGAKAYVDLILAWHARHPGRPLLVAMGGQSATLASAFQRNPAIADKVIVFYVSANAYNGQLSWASEIICQKMRVVHAYHYWWPEVGLPNQLQALPRNNSEDWNDISGEWAVLANLKNLLGRASLPFMDDPYKDKFNCGGLLERLKRNNQYNGGHHQKGWGDDAYSDGNIFAAWQPAMYRKALLRIMRGGEVLDHEYHLDWLDRRAIHAATFPFLSNPDAYRQDGGRAAQLTPKVHPIHFASPASVTLQDGLWGPVLERNRTVTIPHVLKMCEEAGMFRDFDRAAGKLEGPAEALHISDETVYKALEAAALELARRPDPALEKQLDDLIARIAAAQQPDGYLHTPYQIAKRRGQPVPAPFEDNGRGLELYFCGHLFEAATAHYRAAGRTNFLAAALRNAELVHRVFGPGKRVDVAEHEEIEPALIKLYEATGDDRWWRLAQFFVETRGTTAGGRQLRGPFSQDHAPIRAQTEVVGQAPRATYFYSGVVDVAGLAGDATLMMPMNRLWDEVVGRKLYLTGGIGSRHSNEGFGDPYELPNLTAYTEICAAISFSMWNERMFRATGEGRFMDVLERTLYNNFLAGVSLSGDRYFYACPPQSDGKYAFNRGWLPKDRKGPHTQASATRKEWFECACCPPNWARWVVQVPGFICAARSNGLFVNLYAASAAEVTVGGQRWKVRQETQYPWDGKIHLRLESEAPRPSADFTLRLRVPGWARGEPVPGDLYRYVDGAPASPVHLRVNGAAVPVKVEHGYAVLRRAWQSGDAVELDLPMPVRRVVAHPAAKDLAGQVAVERGPIVYCAEGVDHQGRVLDLALPDGAPLAPGFDRDFAGGVTVLRGEARRGSQAVPLRLIPYFTWANRGVTEMTVWLKQAKP